MSVYAFPSIYEKTPASRIRSRAPSCSLNVVRKGSGCVFGFSSSEEEEQEEEDALRKAGFGEGRGRLAASFTDPTCACCLFRATAVCDGTRLVPFAFTVSLPSLNRTPQALQSVFGPNGPFLQSGVFCVRQCAQLRPGAALTETAGEEASNFIVALELFFERSPCVNLSS